MVYIQLCGIASDQPDEVADALETLDGGRWTLVWGPVRDDDGANLAFVAAFREEPESEPTEIVLTIRGADPGTAFSDLIQAYEDLGVETQSPFPNLPARADARVADGTLDALAAVVAMRDGDIGLVDVLERYCLSRAYGRPELVVTGHGLGGCLATVIAPWLRQKFGAGVAITPVTFAAPAAGNVHFARYYDRSFPTAVRYWNNIDIVPRAWRETAAIPDLVPDRPAPSWVRAMLDAWQATGMLSAYEQPGTAIVLPGSPQGAPRWAAEAMYQHHHQTYIALLGGPRQRAEGQIPGRTRRRSADERAAILTIAPPAENDADW